MARKDKEELTQEEWEKATIADLNQDMQDCQKNRADNYGSYGEISSDSEMISLIFSSKHIDYCKKRKFGTPEKVLFLLALCFKEINSTKDVQKIRVPEKVKLLEDLCKFEVLTNSFQDNTLRQRVFNLLFKDKDCEAVLKHIKQHSLRLTWLLELIEQPRSNQQLTKLLRAALGKKASGEQGWGNDFFFLLKTCSKIVFSTKQELLVDEFFLGLMEDYESSRGSFGFVDLYANIFTTIRHLKAKTRLAVLCERKIEELLKEIGERDGLFSGKVNDLHSLMERLLKAKFPHKLNSLAVAKAWLDDIKKDISKDTPWEEVQQIFQGLRTDLENIKPSAALKDLKFVANDKWHHDEGYEVGGYPDDDSYQTGTSLDDHLKVKVEEFLQALWQHLLENLFQPTKK